MMLVLYQLHQLSSGAFSKVYLSELYMTVHRDLHCRYCSLRSNTIVWGLEAMQGGHFTAYRLYPRMRYTLDGVSPDLTLAKVRAELAVGIRSGSK
jgi:hypothetical protein